MLFSELWCLLGFYHELRIIFASIIDLFKQHLSDKTSLLIFSLRFPENLSSQGQFWFLFHTLLLTHEQVDRELNETEFFLNTNRLEFGNITILLPCVPMAAKIVFGVKRRSISHVSAATYEKEDIAVFRHTIIA